MIKKTIEVFLFISAITLCYFSYTYMSSVNVESFSQQKAKTLFDKTSKVKMILDIPSNNDKIIIKDYESKVAVRDLQSIEDEVAALSISYEKLSKLHSNKINMIFYFSLATLLFTGFLILANRFETRQNGLLEKNSANIIGKYNNTSPLQKNNHQGSVLARLEAEQASGQGRIYSNQDGNPNESSIENFLTNSLILNSHDDYELTKIETTQEDSISYGVSSNSENPLMIQYDLIQGFISDLSYSCTNLVPNVELTRDVSSQKLNFTVDFEPIANAGDNLNV